MCITATALPPAVRQEAQTWGFINGLRGLLALWVVAGHSLNACNATLSDLSTPALAVDVFMVISGFLMAAHFYDREQREPWDSPRTWTRFYVRRFFRIAPAYYLALGAAFFFAARYATYWVDLNSTLTRLPAEAPAAIDVAPFDPSLRSLLVHATFLFGFIPKYVATVACIPDWSIALEMQFYLAFPFIMLALRRRGLAVVTLVTLLIGFIAYSLWGVYAAGWGPLGVFPQPSFLPFKLSWFLIGILLAESVRQRERRDPARAALAVSVALFLTYRGHCFSLTFLTLLFAVLAHRNALDPALGLAAKPVRWIDDLLGSRVGTFLADCSYSLYLIHYFALFPIEASLRANPAFAALPPVARAGVLFGAVVTVALPVSYAIHRLVEQPGIELGRRLLRASALRPTGANATLAPSSGR